MIQFKLLTTSILFALTIMAFENSYSQSNLSAILSQEGVSNYKITKGSFYLYISQGGQITGFGALVK